jgi:hypothetical protein
MYEIEFTLFFLSLIFSFLLIISIQWIKKPRLEIKISDYSFHNNDRMKIAHVKVRNKKIKCLSWFMNRDFATNCRAHIDILDSSNGQLIKKFDGLKWALNPEPLKYDFRDNGILVMQDSAIAMTADVRNIGERWEDLDIAVKHEGDQELYINTPKNYPLNMKPGVTKIDRRRCIIDIRIIYDNGESDTSRFYLRNDSSSIRDFELSESPFS